jgi:hypothetical protein
MHSFLKQVSARVQVTLGSCKRLQLCVEPSGGSGRFPVKNRKFTGRGTRFTCTSRYAASVVTSIGSVMDGSSFSGLFTRVEIGQMRMSSAGNGRIKSRGSASSPSQRA